MAEEQPVPTQSSGSSALSEHFLEERCNSHPFSVLVLFCVV